MHWTLNVFEGNQIYLHLLLTHSHCLICLTYSGNEQFRSMCVDCKQFLWENAFGRHSLYSITNEWMNELTTPINYNWKEMKRKKKCLSLSATTILSVTLFAQMCKWRLKWFCNNVYSRPATNHFIHHSSLKWPYINNTRLSSQLIRWFCRDGH